ncbi:MAG: hypothetical protein Q8S71_06200, partial [Hydrogenophaga sp.]|nr:hypothetical protein [Hydrogenophaga sp.]
EVDLQRIQSAAPDGGEVGGGEQRQGVVHKAGGRVDQRNVSQSSSVAISLQQPKKNFPPPHEYLVATSLLRLQPHDR